MARLPQPGGDAGNWGEILNEYLSVAHKTDGTLASNTVDSTQLKANNAPSNGTVLGWNGTSLTWTAPSAASVTSVAGKNGAVTLVKADVGLANVDDTADIDKPISTATQTALNTKANTSSLAPVATSGSYSDLTNKPSIPTDSTLVHLTGAETISGNKDFTGSLTQNGNAIVTTVDGRLSNTRTPTDNTVSTAKIQDNAITTAKVEDGAITNAKLANNVQTMMTDTQTAASNAATSATNASNSATAAANSATAANTSAGNASTSANTASTAATNAGTAQTAAEAARDETIVTVDGQTSWTGAVSLTAAQSKSKYIRRLLTGNVTITMASGESGKAYSCTLELQQDATGSRTIVLANVATPYGVTLPISTTASAVDIFRLEWNGTRWAAFVAGPQMSIPAAWTM